MRETSETWTRTPEWAIVDVPQIYPAMELTCSESGPIAIPAVGPWRDAGLQALRELEEIRRVSARLFPQNLPHLESLSYGGICIEARCAGGDFYDFFDRGQHRLGFVVGDVSGKGMASALVRATAQATLRTLCATGVEDFEQSLALLNRLLFDSTPEAMYTTLFFAEYDERTRRIRYVNCGHPAPLLCGRNGVSRLESTSGVLGLFNEWTCSVGEVQFEAGDTLLLYTDGVTEAADDAEEFGQERLLAMMAAQGQLSVPAFLQQCVREICRFESAHQRDDLTLVALRGVAA